MLLLEAVRVLSTIDKTLHIILTQMQELARTLKEYDVVRDMPGAVSYTHLRAHET